MDERTPLVQTVVVTRPARRFPHQTFRRFCTIALTSVLVLVCIGLVLPFSLWPEHNHQHRHHHNYSYSDLLPWSKPYPPSWPASTGMNITELTDIVLNTPDPQKAREWSKYYTSGPHLAGKNLSQAIWTRERWEEYGIKSEIMAYDVYMSYPLDHRLALLKDQEVDFECSLKEDILKEDPTTTNQEIPTFHGYSGSGNVTSRYVYVNFGTYQDFEDLQKAGIELEGNIAIAKYGRIFRGLKVKRAQELGMIGVVIYTDPQEDGEITERNGYKQYPHGPARQESSVQRGSVQYISVAGVLPGDPTTPGYPSKPGVPRVDPHGSTPMIPSLPISYKDALPILKALNGHGPNATSFGKPWEGGGLGYKGIDYNIGPSPKGVTLNLLNQQEYTITPIWNVIGVINGTTPDEVIVIGNHRDAWITGGAGDPHSGTVVVNEVIRSLSQAMSSGWKPLRTIVFASWDGEEYGLVGSTEWVEEFLPWLSATAVTYLNVDVGARGDAFDSAASPILNTLIYNTTALIPAPNRKQSGSIYDNWKGKVIRTMGSGSDFTSFQDFVGVSSMDFGFTRSDTDPVYHYHSNYDSFYWMDNIGDPGWHHHVAVAKLMGMFIVKLSEQAVLPFNATDYALGLERYLNTVKDKAKELSSDFSFAKLDHSIAKLQQSAISFDTYTSDLTARLGENTPWWKWWKKVKLYYEVRKANAKYKLLDRQFLFADGLDDRPWFKHVVFAPGRWTGYAGATFPGLVESFEDKNVTNAKRWAKVINDRLHAATKLLD